MSLDYRTMTDAQVHSLLAGSWDDGGVRRAVLTQLLKQSDEDDRWRVAITLACKRWGWEHCTTEVELIAQIDSLLDAISGVHWVGRMTELNEALCVALGWKHGVGGWYHPDGDPTNDGVVYYYEVAPAFDSAPIVRGMQEFWQFDEKVHALGRAPGRSGPEWEYMLLSHARPISGYGDTKLEAKARAVIAAVEAKM